MTYNLHRGDSSQWACCLCNCCCSAIGVRGGARCEFAIPVSQIQRLQWCWFGVQGLVSACCVCICCCGGLCVVGGAAQVVMVLSQASNAGWHAGNQSRELDKGVLTAAASDTHHHTCDILPSTFQVWQLPSVAVQRCTSGKGLVCLTGTGLHVGFDEQYCSYFCTVQPYMQHCTTVFSQKLILPLVHF